ncbi:MAG: HAD family hydrolase [Ardenticatenaceae bacterium]|nr:HAD family hydrolase [Ardenticatenaceae bacterium]
MRRVIRAVLFDLGGTLWHPVTQAERAQVLAAAGARLTQMLREQGHAPVPDPVRLAQAVEAAAWRAEQQAALTPLAVPAGLEIFAHTLAEFGLRLSVATCAPLRAAFSAEMVAERALYPKALETLAALRGRHLRLAVVSDQVWGEGCRQEIERSGLAHFFQSIVLSCEVGWMKPHPHIFQAALSELGVHPEEAVMVGDNLRADVLGAQAMGMMAIWKRAPGEAAGDIQPDAIIERLGELLELLP